MIEVEKRFKLEGNQLNALLENAEFLGEVVNHDIYYDYSDYRFFKGGIKLRKRNESFELKIKVVGEVGEQAKAEKEIEDKMEIEKYFNTENLEKFIEENLIVFTDYKTARKKYRKEGFNIDVDILDFGLSFCDVELMVENEKEIEEAENKIINFTKQYGIKFENLPQKRVEYLRLVKPEIYKELYLDK